MVKITDIYKLFIKFPLITTDTRKITHNSIFFALKGSNFNGNTFAAKALAEGCSFAIIDEKEYQLDERFILVTDALKTLQELARIHRKKITKTKIIAITGTNGKTTTKELLNAVLSKKFKVVSTGGNLNNHIGVPLTLLSMTGETEFGIVEIGANHIGEIKALCDIAEPDYGLITNIGKAHLEGFGSFHGIKKAKSELYVYLAQKNKTAFINSGNKILMKLSSGLTAITYGTSKKSQYYGNIINADPFLTLNIPSDNSSKAKYESALNKITTRLVGEYNFENVLAAVSIGKYFGVDDIDIKEAIEGYEPVNNRSQLVKTKYNTLLLDFYNANPTSMELAIKNFAGINKDNKYMILGDMFELGKHSIKEHSKILSMLKKYNYKNVILIGKYFHLLSKNSGFTSFENTDDFIERVKASRIMGFYILIKGSRGMSLEKITAFL